MSDKKQKSVSALLSRAATHARKGEIAEARASYEAILERFPQNERAKRGLETLDTMSHLPASPPASLSSSVPAGGALGNGGSAPQGGASLPLADKDKLVGLLEQEKLDEAIAFAKQLYQIYPQAVILPRMISMTYALQKNAQQSAYWGEELLRHEAGDVEDYLRLASSYNDAEDYESVRSALEKAVALAPENPEALRGLASCLCVMYDYEQGAEYYHKLLEITPDDTDVLREAAKCYRELDYHRRSVELVEKAAELQPDDPDVIVELGTAYSAARQHKKAVRAYEQALQAKSDDAYLYVSLAQSLRDDDQLERGFEMVEKAFALEPDLWEAYQCRGALHNAARDKPAALADYETALKLKPDSSNLWHHYSTIKKYKADDPDFATMEARLQALSDARADWDARILLGFALGKAYDDIGDVDKSFHHTMAAAKLRKEKLKYDFEEEKKRFATTKHVFAPLDESDYVRDEIQLKKKMIFVLGMPRSGTSLTEQILDSHSLVHGAGELNFLNEQTSELLYMFGLQPEVAMQKIAFISIGNSYMDSIYGLGAEEPYITDKLPHNFARLGFILGAFPDAKIIHMNRDPLAVCWSNFQRFFPARGMGFSFDFDTLGQYYKLYLDIMDFWRAKFPGRIYDLHYEQLTQNQEEETRKLLDHCGLAWEPQCLEFHKNTRHVHTASQNQVQQKMYQGSSQAWRAYAKHLAPLMEELGYPLS